MCIERLIRGLLPIGVLATGVLLYASANPTSTKTHWAFVPPRRPTPPTVRLASWPRNPIDKFILARLEQEKLAPSPWADRTTLLRRVSLDLTGIPPTPAEVDSFLNDHTPNAYEKVVDRLLASPRYGERMAMDWLDGARYADSNGYQADYERYQWLWRDWVINAYNQNLPFDAFTLDQIAGDLLPNATQEQKVATGFNRNHRINTEGGVIPEEWRVETVIDRVETTSAVWLGLTMGCGRCHDHKYDPITQNDFYRFFAFFNNVPESGTGVERPENHPPLLKLPSSEQEQHLAELNRKLPELSAWLNTRLAANATKSTDWRAEDIAHLTDKDPAKPLLSIAPDKRTEPQKRELNRLWSERYDEEYKQRLTERNAAEKDRAETEGKINSVMVMEEMPQPRDCFVLIRGQYDHHGPKVTAAIPAVFGALLPDTPNNRLGLAQWIVSPSNPLTARVAVNRMWEKLFGVGLVRTSEDFGTRAEVPSHPELLDWLATEFIRLHWDMKALQKEIVMSATYRQSSRLTPELLRRDP
ncbi:MAG TPA: DUF1549 and DUF1553 domain-containing protein, partial [Chthonomonadaceae bacterium]|nr:DUF1549 and DUF1553 domain-containing protein [Chthonomonadaceae bacterium]